MSKRIGTVIFYVIVGYVFLIAVATDYASQFLPHGH